MCGIPHAHTESQCRFCERCWSVACPQKQQWLRPEALQERRVAPEAAVAASGSIAAALRAPPGSGYRVLKRCTSVVWPRSSSCSVQERCGSVARPPKQQLQRLGALQERIRGEKAAFATSRSAAGACRDKNSVVSWNFTPRPSIDPLY